MLLRSGGNEQQGKGISLSVFFPVVFKAPTHRSSEPNQREPTNLGIFTIVRNPCWPRSGAGPGSGLAATLEQQTVCDRHAGHLHAQNSFVCGSLNG
jgi:hypothetical protein